MAKPLERDQIQGIVKSAYGHLPAAAYVLLTIDPVRAGEAGRWFGSLAPEITTCEKKRTEESLNVAFTCTGLRHLGAPAAAVDTFSVAFVDGMTSPRRASILGDVESTGDAPLRWGGSAHEVDALLLVYARDEPSLEGRVRDLVAHATASGIASRVLRTGVYPDRREHFGFADGISQPILEGLRSKHPRPKTPRSQEVQVQAERAVAGGDVAHQRDLVKDGEFVLGYKNEYGYVSEAPRLGPEHDLGRNGSYLVFRQLTQDVAAFSTFLDMHADGDPNARDLLAAKIIGRWKNGAPLVTTTRAEDPAFAASPGRAAQNRANDFGFAEDPEGLRCPLGAHIRRANPRDGSMPGNPGESLRRTARHRLLRRGRSYGPGIDDPSATQQSERGLYFIALCADIERQFEFIQQTWINNPAFNDLDEVDPLVGRQSAESTFTIQGPIVRRRVKGLQSFVQFVGGAYFFVPSIAALEWLARSAASKSKWGASDAALPVATHARALTC